MSGEVVGFRMRLAPGQGDVYRARHDAIWPELVTLLRETGISDYSIFLHEPTNSLFAVLRRGPDHSMDGLPESEIMQRWWRHMADIMVTEPDGAPLVEMLPMMFHLP